MSVSGPRWVRHHRTSRAMSPSGSSDDQGGLAARSPGDDSGRATSGPDRGRCEDQDREAIHSAAAAGASWDGTSTSGAIGSSENRSPVRACEMPVVRTMVRPVYSGYS